MSDDSSYLIEIVARLRDEASASIDGLKRKVAELQAQAAGGNAVSDLERGLSNLASSADDARDSHQSLGNAQQDAARKAQIARAETDKLARTHDAGATLFER